MLIIKVAFLSIRKTLLRNETIFRKMIDDKYYLDKGLSILQVLSLLKIEKLNLSSIEKQKLLVLLVEKYSTAIYRNLSTEGLGRMFLDFIEKKWDCSTLPDYFLNQKMYENFINLFLELLCRKKYLAAGKLIHAIEGSDFFVPDIICFWICKNLQRVRVKALDHSTYQMLRVFMNNVILEQYSHFLLSNRNSPCSHEMLIVLSTVVKFRFYNRKLLENYLRLLETPLRFFNRFDFKNYLSICFYLTKIGGYNSQITFFIQETFSLFGETLPNEQKLKLWILMAQLELRKSFSEKKLIEKTPFFLFWNWTSPCSALFSPIMIEKMLKGVSLSHPMEVDFFTHHLLEKLYGKIPLLKKSLDLNFFSQPASHHTSHDEDDIDKELYENLKELGSDYIVEKEFKVGHVFADLSLFHRKRCKRWNFELQGPFHFHEFGQLDFDSLLRCFVKGRDCALLSLDKELLVVHRLNGTLKTLIGEAIKHQESNFVELNYEFLES